MSKTTSQMSINALHFRSHSKIFDFRWTDSMFAYRKVVQWFLSMLGNIP